MTKLISEGWSFHSRFAVLKTHQTGQDGREGKQEPLETLLKQWRHAVAPEDPETFQKRILWTGLRPNELAQLLDPAADMAPNDEEWIQRLGKIQSEWLQADIPSQPKSSTTGSRAFEDVWQPTVSLALLELKKQCQDRIERKVSHKAWIDLSNNLLERLCDTTEQALWDLFNRHRSPGQMLAAHIASRSPTNNRQTNSIYLQFVQKIHASKFDIIFSEYPVLGRLVATLVNLWLESSAELLHRVDAEQTALNVKFNIPLEATLTAVTPGKGDYHCGGRSVSILTFSEASTAPEKRIVYKPKDMQVDVAYQEFLALLNDLGSEHHSLSPLKTLAVASGKGYGFLEFVEHQTCSKESMLSEFYFNSGRLLAVLYLLGCTDCHHENLIANGNQLVLIDTETLFDTDVQDFVSANPKEPSILELKMRRSVLQTGLLPNWYTYAEAGMIPCDVSALGIEPPSAEVETTGWLAVNTDGMLSGKKTMASTQPTSLPIGNDGRNRLNDFATVLLAGFRKQMDLVLQCHDQLITGLNRFSGLPRRLLTRQTSIYFRIQQQLLTPSALRSAMAQGMVLEQLSRSYLLADQCPTNWPMFFSEVRQMERLDIPFFLHNIDGKDLPLGEGFGSIEGFMKTNGLESSRNRLRVLDSADIHFQEKLIMGSIAARFGQHNKLKSEGKLCRSGSAKTTPPTPKSYDPRMEAVRLAENLWMEKLSNRHGLPEWLGFDLIGDNTDTYQFGLIGPSLYSGSAGIAVLFSRLSDFHSQAGELIQASRWRQRADQAIAGILEALPLNQAVEMQRLLRDLHLGLNGIGGLLLTFQLVGGYNTVIEEILSHITLDRLERDHSFDLMLGVTGLIGPLLRHGSDRARDLARGCAEHLLAHQTDEGGWPQPQRGRTGGSPLTGLSHGAAGIAAAMAHIATQEGNQRYADAARSAMKYERSRFSREHNNWPFFGSNDEAPSFWISWCHGAPGIALGRLALRDTCCWDEEVEAEIEVGLQTALNALETSAVENSRDHLCCGRLGLTTIIRIAWDAGSPLPETALSDASRMEAAVMAAAAKREGRYSFHTVAEGMIDMPGLFTGNAGVALALLESVAGLTHLPALLSGALLSRQ